MGNSIWVKMHGGATHFPIALVMASVTFDLAAGIVPDSADGSRRAGFRAAGHYWLVLAALGAIGAGVSGSMVSRGQLWGHGNLAHHHTFLWPAFGMVLALASWRLVVGGRASHAAFGIYLTVSILTGGLMAAAGYWGGELLING